MADQQNPCEFILSVKVIPKARRTEIVEWEQNQLKIRLKAIPEKGKANEKVIELLSKHFKVPKSDIEIIRGAAYKEKIIFVQND